MENIGSITVNEDGTLNVPKNIYEAIAQLAKAKYNFRGSSERTIRKYVTKFLNDALSDSVVAVPKEFLPKGRNE